MGVNIYTRDTYVDANKKTRRFVMKLILVIACIHSDAAVKRIIPLRSAAKTIKGSMRQFYEQSKLEFIGRYNRISNIRIKKWNKVVSKKKL